MQNKLEGVMELIGNILLIVLQVYWFIMLARILLTWLPNLDYSNPIVRFLYQSTEPVLKPVREKLPPMQGMDLSPIVVFIGLFVLRIVIRSIFF
jgi:YggT family protein